MWASIRPIYVNVAQWNLQTVSEEHQGTCNGKHDRSLPADFLIFKKDLHSPCMVFSTSWNKSPCHACYDTLIHAISKEKVKVKLKPLMLEEQQIVPESSDKDVKCNSPEEESLLLDEDEPFHEDPDTMDESDDRPDPNSIIEFDFQAVVPDVTGQSAAVGENPMNILESQLEFKLSFPEFSGEAEMKEYAPDYFDDLGETFEALSRPASPASHVSPNDDEIDDTEVDELAGFNLPPPEHIASFAVDPAFPEAEVTIDTQILQILRMMQSVPEVEAFLMMEVRHLLAPRTTVRVLSSLHRPLRPHVRNSVLPQQNTETLMRKEEIRHTATFF
ncbi:unnamed protein product [Notodromas monacha]|uniref:Uncharacterized protein n=1 Tax=Notodromas monacha TaxID=399045 RepID=A0A7R9BS27_9CRUS|nr:unnamed protein product [Notodromas monacha]CAG0920658.1 unnamed protein product [Notodromas monacha]